MAGRIYAIADTMPEESVFTTVTRERPDLIVLAGDLAGPWLSDVSRVCASLGIPVVGAYGNHCMPGYLEDIGAVHLHGQVQPIRLAHGTTIQVAGFDGCVRYKAGKYIMYSEEEMEDLVTKALADHDGTRIDLVVTHAPPRGINDTVELDDIAPGWRRTPLTRKDWLENPIEPEDVTHSGFNAFRRLLHDVRPADWIHGHTYPKKRLQPFDRLVDATAVHYVLGGRMVQCGEAQPDPIAAVRPASV